MGKSSPAAPDYRGAAEAQADASKEVTRDQTWANRPNLSTPWGSQTWNSSTAIDPSTGQPVTQWSSNIKLSPQQQAALDSQMAVQTGRSRAAEQMLGRATDSLGGPLDYSGISEGGSRIDGNSDEWRQKAQDAVLQFQKPLQDQRREGTEAQLANMGLTRGSEAWNREMQRLSDQDARDNLQAFDSARAEAAFGLDSAIKGGSYNQTLRQQEIAEMLNQRQQPLNELNALLTGQQVANPAMPNYSQAGASQTPQYLSAAGQQYQAGLDAYNVDQANTSSTLGALGTVASLFMLSDKRLKTDIKLITTLKNGIRIYSYRWIGTMIRQVGVLAQEVMTTMPDAVKLGDDGYYRVNYAHILEAA